MLEDSYCLMHLRIDKICKKGGKEGRGEHNKEIREK